MEVIVLILSFLGLLLLNVPVAFCIGLSTLFFLLVIMDFTPSVSAIAQRVATGLDSFTLLAIPFFILAGNLMGRGGSTQRLIVLARTLVSSLPGGLAFVNIISNMFFGAISGSAIASAAAIGSVMHPRMVTSGYSPGYSVAVNVSSATTGLVIPPSNVLIVYSLASGGLSVAALFVAGYLPGILMGLVLMIVAGVVARIKGFGASERVPLRELFRCFLDALPSLGLIVVVIGGIVAGIFTATEAAAIAVVYALVLSTVIYRALRLSELVEVLLDSAKTTAVVMLLIATSMALSWALALERVPQAVGEALIALGQNPVVFLLLVNVMLLVVGTFMDMTPAILIFTPILLPTAMEMGIDPVHFGILMVVNLCIGLCTPPVGTVLFAGCGIAGVPVTQVVRPLLPFYIALLVALLAVTFIPGLSLWLPRLLGLI
ncbi:TRAP transporter large permease [Rhodothermus profundi]